MAAIRRVNSAKINMPKISKAAIIKYESPILNGMFFATVSHINSGL